MKHHDLTPNTNTMNTKHTHGPWETNRQSGITYVWQGGTSNAIAKVYADVNEDSEANACLIAAATELLEALQVLSDAAGRVAQGATVIDERGFNTLAHPISVALAAIAKATEK